MNTCRYACILNITPYPNMNTATRDARKWTEYGQPPKPAVTKLITGYLLWQPPNQNTNRHWPTWPAKQ